MSQAPSLYNIPNGQGLEINMLKLIVGVKGTGKTKEIVSLANAAANESKGCVVFLEQGNKLRFDVTHKVRLVDTCEFGIMDGQSLYGFVAGIYASNHDITDIFIDSALKICQNSMDEFILAVKELDAFVSKYPVNCVMTSSIPVEDVREELKAYI